MSTGITALGPFGQAVGMHGLIGKMTPAPGRRDELVAILLDGVRSATPGGPPFQRLAPEDLHVEMLGTEAAVATFHLRNAARLARRTIVLRRRERGWLIAHMHATNVPRP